MAFHIEPLAGLLYGCGGVQPYLNILNTHDASKLCQRYKLSPDALRFGGAAADMHGHRGLQKLPAPHLDHAAPLCRLADSLDRITTWRCCRRGVRSLPQRCWRQRLCWQYWMRRFRRMAARASRTMSLWRGCGPEHAHCASRTAPMMSTSSLSPSWSSRTAAPSYRCACRLPAWLEDSRLSASSFSCSQCILGDHWGNFR